MDNSNNKSNLFNNWVHKFGLISGFTILLLMLAVPVISCTLYNMWPNLRSLIPSFISVAMLMLPFCIAECIAYPPIIGSGAVYMAYITGNTTALKMPCAISALKIAGVKQGTVESDAVSLVAVGTSTLTVTIVIIIGMLLSTQLAPILNSPVLKPGFNNLLPSIFGALAVGSIMGKVKYFITPFIVALFFAKFTHISSAYYMLIAIVASAVIGSILHSKEAASNGTIAQ
ncbi:MAG: hypothetical protein AAGU76_03415 [Sedimentibacter sp.]|uniref:hypothetical protein n=1 Tax=Sedimentibacter sp. TaxID=1960295 RepID=UPI003158CEC6